MNESDDMSVQTNSDPKEELLTLDMDEDARERLALSVLQGAGRGTGPRADACRAAFEQYRDSIRAGASSPKAREAAKRVLASHGR